MTYSVGILSGDHTFYKAWFKAFIDHHGGQAGFTWHQVGIWLEQYNAKHLMLGEGTNTQYTLEFQTEKDYTMFLLRFS